MKEMREPPVWIKRNVTSKRGALSTKDSFDRVVPARYVKGRVERALWVETDLRS